MSNSASSSLLIQNYPLYYISTTSRRYERDRQTTNATINRQTQQLVGAIYPPFNRNDLVVHSENTAPQTTYRKQRQQPLDRLIYQSTGAQKDKFTTMFRTYHHRSLRFIPTAAAVAAAAILGNSNRNIANKLLQLSPKSKELINNNRRLCGRRNIKHFLILTVTFISLANIANEGRILCDRIYPHELLHNEAQTVSPFPGHAAF